MKTGNTIVIIAGVFLLVLGFTGGNGQANAFLIGGPILISGGMIAAGLERLASRSASASENQNAGEESKV